MVAVASLLLITPSQHAYAQETQDISGQSAWLEPSFRVGNIVINQESLAQGVISGTVDVQNRNNAAFGGIGMQLLLLDLPPESETSALQIDNAQVYDRVLLPVTTSFEANERKTLPFSYIPPAVAEGRYRVRLQVTTANGNRYGWDDQAVSLASQDKPFLLIANTALHAHGGTFDPLEGVTVQPGEALSIPIEATNSSSVAVSARPVVTIRKFELAGEVLETKQGAIAPIAAGETWTGPFDFAASSTPGTYYASLTFEDEAGSRVSSLGQYRWVVAGSSARVISARFISVDAQNASTQIEIAGPADDQTTINARATIALLDGSSVLQEKSTSFPSLNAALRTFTADFSTGKTLAQPGLRITLTDEATGNMLDTYETHIAGTGEPQQETASAIETVIQVPTGVKTILIVTILVILLIIAVVVQKRSVPPVAILALAGALLLGAASLHSPSARAVGNFASNPGEGVQLTQFQASYMISVTINRPLHDNDMVDEPVDPASIPVALDIKYSSCYNATEDRVQIAVYNLRNGGKKALTATNIEATAEDRTSLSDEEKGFDRPFLFDVTGPEGIQWNKYTFINGTSDDASVGSFDRLLWYSGSHRFCGHKCDFALNHTGSITLPESLTNTTLLWLFYLNRVDAEDAEEFSTTVPRALQSMYSWINIKPSETDLSIIKSAPDSIGPDEDIAYTITVENKGDADAKNVVVRDNVPAGLAWDASQSTPGCSQTGNTVLCSIPVLAAHETKTITLSFIQGTITTTPATSASPTPTPSPTTPPTYTFTYQQAPIIFINSLGTFGTIIADSVRSTSTNALKLCNLKGYATVSKYTTRDYSSPWNNTIATWSESKQTFTVQNAGAAGNPGQIDTLTCKDPITIPNDPENPTDPGTPSTTIINPVPLACDSVVTNTATVTSENSDPEEGNNTSTATITVSCPPPPPNPVTITLLLNGSANPVPLPVNTTATLSWSSTNADSCKASRNWIGNKATAGSEPVTLSVPGLYSYKINCVNSVTGSKAHKTLNVEAIAAPEQKFQCNDEVDNDDPEDTLADSADPGCHVGDNINNAYVPEDDDETNSSSGTDDGGNDDGGGNDGGGNNGGGNDDDGGSGPGGVVETR